MPLHLNSMTEELAPLMQGKRNELRFNGPMKRSELTELLEAIPTLPSLKLLHLDQAFLQEQDVKRLATALAQRDDLQELGLHKSPISDEAAIALGASLKHHSGLRSLQISYCDLSEKGMNALVDVIATAPQIRHLTASGNKWNQDTHDKLAVALSDKSDLATLSVWRDDKPPLDEHALERALLHNPHPNLVTITGIHSDAIDALTSRNLAARVEAGQFLSVLAKSNGDYATGVNPQKRTPLYDAERQITGVLATDINLTDAIFKTQTRRAALIDYNRGDAALKPLDALLEQMPSIPAGKAVTVNALFKEDAHGVAPVENPLTWQNHPQLLKEIAAQGGLSHETRQRTTRRGNGLVNSALRNLSTESVVEQLAPLGLRMDAKQLLEEDGKPSKLLDIIFSKGEVSQLFGFNNWVGKSKHEVKSFVSALPAEMQPVVPSLIGLSQQLDRSRPGPSRGR